MNTLSADPVLSEIDIAAISSKHVSPKTNCANLNKPGCSLLMAKIVVLFILTLLCAVLLQQQKRPKEPSDPKRQLQACNQGRCMKQEEDCLLKSCPPASFQVEPLDLASVQAAAEKKKKSEPKPVPKAEPKKKTEAQAAPKQAPKEAPKAEPKKKTEGKAESSAAATSPEAKQQAQRVSYVPLLIFENQFCS